MDEPPGESTLDPIVLIAEDEPDNREIMRTVIEDLLGLRVVVATDGYSAVELAVKLRPALILMDLMMPVLDGFEAIASLKSKAETASIPIIAITALGRPLDREQALECGANGYMSKPFDLDELADAVRLYALAPDLNAPEK